MDNYHTCVLCNIVEVQNSATRNMTCVVLYTFAVPTAGMTILRFRFSLTGDLDEYNSDVTTLSLVFLETQVGI